MQKINQSLYDHLLNYIPNMGNLFFNKDHVNPEVSSNLFTIWKKNNKLGANSFKRPSDMSIYEMKDMKKAGLIRSFGESIELTKKGKEIIKVMILGDSRSVFQDNDTIIDYNEALANTKNIKMAKTKGMKIASNNNLKSNWYKKAQAKDKEPCEDCSVKEAQRARYQGQTQGDEARGVGDASTEYFESRAKELSQEIAIMKSLFDRALKGDNNANGLINDYIQKLKLKGFSQNVIEKEIINPAMYKRRF